MLYIGAIDDRRRSILNLSSLLAINHPVKIEEIMKKSLSWIGIVILAAILDIYNKFISNSPSFEQRTQSSSSPPLRKIELCACKSFIRGGEGRERGREIDGGLKKDGFFRRTRFTRSFFTFPACFCAETCRFRIVGRPFVLPEGEGRGNLWILLAETRRTLSFALPSSIDSARRIE